MVAHWRVSSIAKLSCALSAHSGNVEIEGPAGGDGSLRANGAGLSGGSNSGRGPHFVLEIRG